MNWLIGIFIVIAGLSCLFGWCLFRYVQWADRERERLAEILEDGWKNPDEHQK